MSGVLRVILFVYNVLILTVGGAAVAAAIGRPEPMKYIQLALSTSENRIILGLVGLILIIITLVVFVSLFRREPKEQSILVENSQSGQISMTIAAAKVIISKAVQKVEGVKETRTVVKNEAGGLMIYLHMMINPDMNVPELSKQVQDAVSEDMLYIGGLQVKEIRVLIDDFNTARKPASN